ncbi:LysM domain-containing protein, partial [Paenibacillus xylanexedens]|uniref:LysM domain-containing protein n=1 Tax=Paenibacillus xylanexedens TaxID=528191 RepID=UPI0028EAD7D6
MDTQWIIVQRGDTLPRIASAHHMTKELLAALNPEVASQPYLLAGQMLRIVPGTGRRYAVPPGESVGEIAGRFGLDEEVLRQANPEITNITDWVGRCIHIPASDGKTIVKIQGEYGYRELIRDLDKLENQYPFIETGSIGTSVMGKS